MSALFFGDDAMQLDDVMNELAKISRERAIVKGSAVSPAMKDKLLQQLADKAQALEARLVEVPAPGTGVPGAKTPVK